MKVGDKVSVLDDDISGIVRSISDNVVLISTEDGFEMEFDYNELVIISNEISKREFVPQNMRQILSEKEGNNKRTEKTGKSKNRMQPPMEVDLHIHQLVPKSKGMSNYDMLNIQIDTAKRQLDFAIKKRIQRVVFIHGIGAGVLRAELEYLFRQYDSLQYNDADFQKYGRGATEVYIFQNKRP